MTTDKPPLFEDFGASLATAMVPKRARHYDDWLRAYVEYASIGEAPAHMNFWTGVSVLAGALRRKVWLDMKKFKWYPSLYVVLVAKPGIVAKTSTMDVGMDLLKQVPGIKFGPSIVTWQKMVTAFAEAAETFIWDGMHHPMSALTFASGEFGNLINMQDRDMINAFITLYDNKTFSKQTKHSGDDVVQNPWINLIACTTPSWIADNFNERVIGGGFTSRCIFVFAESKSKLVPYPDEAAPENWEETGRKLTEDLEYISMHFAGPMTLTAAARDYGREWYARHQKERSIAMSDEHFAGYMERKQTHIHKLAIVLSAAVSDSQVIDADVLALADLMVTQTEEELPKVFKGVGRTDVGSHAERLINYIHKRGVVRYEEAYNYVHAHFPSFKDFENVLYGAIHSGQIELVAHPTQGNLLKSKKKAAEVAPAAG